MQRFQRFLLCLTLLGGLGACQATSSPPPMTGVGMTGIDHLADHLSVQDFQVDGRSGFQAGKGGRNVCCAKIPLAWRPGLTVHVTWNVTNWRDRTSEEKSADVPVDRYDEIGRMYVHFLADGQVRVLLSNYVPWGTEYPGPRDIPKKEPWTQYPWPSGAAAQPAP
jgi:hypothetical protein